MCREAEETERDTILLSVGVGMWRGYEKARKEGRGKTRQVLRET
jgi:hypothetical protein